MRRLLLSLLLSSTVLLAGPIEVASGAIHNGITKWQYHQVLVIHKCEEPSWHVNGSMYQGGLGWRPATWVAFRLPWMPVSMAYATVREQTIAMIRFANKYGWPDLHGCYGY